MARKSKAKSQQKSSKAKMLRFENVTSQAEGHGNDQLSSQKFDLAKENGDAVSDACDSSSKTLAGDMDECTVSKVDYDPEKEELDHNKTVSVETEHNENTDQLTDCKGNNNYGNAQSSKAKSISNGEESDKQACLISCCKITDHGKKIVVAGNGYVSRTLCAVLTIAGLVLGIFIGTFISHEQMPTTGNIHNSLEDVGTTGSTGPATTKNTEKAVQAKGKTEIAPPMPRELAQKMTELESAVVSNPSDSSLWTSLGNLYFDSGQPKKAIDAYEKSLALAPGNPDIMTDLGIMYREAGDFEKSVEQFRAASAVSGSHQNALFNEGVVLYYDMGQKDAAIAAWQKLLKVNPQAKGPDGQSVSEMIKHLH